MFLAKEIVFSKLASISGHVISATSDLTEPNKTVTRTFYEDLLTGLRQEINAYYSDLTEKTNMLRVIIMALQQYGLLSGFVSDGVALRNLTGTPPVGYTDLTALYDCNGVLHNFVSTPDSTFYQGSFAVTPPDTDNYILKTFIDDVAAAEKIEQTKRQALNAWINSTNIYNAFMLIFEQAHGSARASVRDIAASIYIERHAKDVIDFYGLDVYVPTYLRS